jgi:DNA-binding NtrC family response regulator
MAHILLVEDSPEVSMTVREILASVGHTIEEAGTGKEAVKLLAASRFDAIVTDIWMPGNQIPVVVISGGAPNAPLTYTAPLAATFGANVVVYKPFEKAELLKAVDTVLSE